MLKNCYIQIKHSKEYMYMKEKRVNGLYVHINMCYMSCNNETELLACQFTIYTLIISNNSLLNIHKVHT